MKKIQTVISFTLISIGVFGQNATQGPVGLYGNSYNAATTILSGGSILISNGGNWFMAGNIISADKNGPNTPNSTGQSETVTFNGTGTISGAATVSGATGNIIDGYASTTGTSASSLLLPLGSGSIAYPLTVPASTAITASQFNGSGSSTNVAVNGTSTTEFSPYYDVPSAIPAGIYSLSYPSGLIPGDNSILRSTDGSSFIAMTNISNISSSAGTVSSANLPASSATRLYFASSVSVLPIILNSFSGNKNNGYNLLQWEMGTMDGVKEFRLQSHGANNQHFALMATIPANADTSAYSYRDFSAQGDAYYMLSVIGLDGSLYNSSTVFLPGNDINSNEVNVYPIPVTGILHVAMNVSARGTVILRVSDINGKEVKQYQELLENNSVFDLDLSSLSKGIYFISINNIGSGNVTVRKFTKL